MSKRIVPFLLIASLLLSLLGGCGSQKESAESGTKTAEQYEVQIAEMQKQIESLKAELEQVKGSAVSDEQTAADNSEASALSNIGTVNPDPENPDEAIQTSAEPLVEDTAEEEDRPQIVVFGDSLWDSYRDETGIAYLVSQYTNADVYNCAIGGTCASMEDWEDNHDYENWNSRSLMGMVNIATGKVDPEYLAGYVAGHVIDSIDFSKTDYFIIAYGLNDYFDSRPVSVSDQRLTDPHGYGGALRLAIEQLREYYPQAQILLISPTYCQFLKDGVMYTDSNMKDFGGGPLTAYANHCQFTAGLTNTLFIDGYNTLGINIYTAEDYLEDGVHLTAAGRELYAKAVSSCLKYGKPGEVSGNSIYY